jgi:hypothetical protein
MNSGPGCRRAGGSGAQARGEADPQRDRPGHHPRGGSLRRAVHGPVSLPARAVVEQRDKRGNVHQYRLTLCPLCVLWSFRPFRNSQSPSTGSGSRAESRDAIRNRLRPIRQSTFPAVNLEGDESGNIPHSSSKCSRIVIGNRTFRATPFIPPADDCPVGSAATCRTGARRRDACRRRCSTYASRLVPCAVLITDHGPLTSDY